MNIPHDSSCHEGSKNVYFIEVRNLEGQNHPGHTVRESLSRPHFSKSLQNIPLVAIGLKLLRLVAWLNAIR